MNGHTLLPQPALRVSKTRTIILLVDCLHIDDGADEQADASELTPKLFEPGSEGAFLLGLGSLLAGGSGGRLLLCSVVPVPEGESMSAHTRVAQARRQKLERLALDALLRGQK